MSSEEVESLEVDDLGFQGKHAINLFSNVSADSLTKLSYNYSINYLTISYSNNTIFAYSNNELKVISLSELSKILESDDEDSDHISKIQLNTFKISDNITQIQLNSDESTLFLTSVKDDQMSILSIDVPILLSDTYNEQEIYKFGKDEKILRLIASPTNPSLLLCLLESGLLYLNNSSNDSTSKILESISAVSWFNDLIVFSYTNDKNVNFFDTSLNKTVSSFTLENFDDEKQICYFKQLNDLNIICVANLIDAEQGDDFTTYFIQLNTSDYSPLKISISTALFSPFGTMERVASFYTLPLNSWSKEYPNLFVSIGSKSCDIDISLINRPVELLNDSDRANLPMDDETGEDDNLLGAVLDLTSTENVKEPCKGVDESGPLPRLIVLTNRGQLVSWNIWSKNDILNNTTDLNKAKDVYTESSSATTTSNENPLVQSKPAVSESVPDLGSLSFGSSKPETKSGSIFSGTQTNPFGSSNPFGLSSPFGSSSANAFGSASATTFGQSSFGKTSNTFTMNQEPKSATEATQSTSAFGSSSTAPIGGFAQSSIASISVSSPFGAISASSTTTSSNGFGKTTFGIGSFKMGDASKPAMTFGSTTTASFGSTESGKSTNSTFTSTAAGGFGQFSKPSNAFGSLANSASSSSPFANLGGSSASPFGSFNKTTEVKKEESKTSVSSPFGNLSASSASPFGSFNKPEAKKEQPKASSPFGNSATPIPTAVGTGQSAPAASFAGGLGNNPPGLFGSPSTINNSPFSGLGASKPTQLFGNPSTFTSKTKSSLSFETRQKIEELESDYEKDEVEEHSGFISADESREEEQASSESESEEYISDEDEFAEEDELEEEDQLEADDQESEEKVLKATHKKLPNSFSSNSKALESPIKIVERIVPLDEQSGRYDFEMNEMISLDDAIKKLIFEKTINVQGGDFDYKTFLEGQAKIYDKLDEKINDLVSAWETKYFKDKENLKRQEEEAVEKKHQERLNYLLKIKEDRDRIFIESEKERKKMLELLKRESDRRSEELKRLNEELEIEDEINAKLKQQEDYDRQTIDLMNAQIKEMESLYNQQQKILEQEIELQRQRAKDAAEEAAEEAKADFEKLARKEVEVDARQKEEEKEKEEEEMEENKKERKEEETQEEEKQEEEKEGEEKEKEEEEMEEEKEEEKLNGAGMNNKERQIEDHTSADKKAALIEVEEKEPESSSLVNLVENSKNALGEQSENIIVEENLKNEQFQTELDETENESDVSIKNDTDSTVSTSQDRSVGSTCIDEAKKTNNDLVISNHAVSLSQDIKDSDSEIDLDKTARGILQEEGEKQVINEDADKLVIATEDENQDVESEVDGGVLVEDDGDELIEDVELTKDLEVKETIGERTTDPNEVCSNVPEKDTEIELAENTTALPEALEQKATENKKPENDEVEKEHTKKEEISTEAIQDLPAVDSEIEQQSLDNAESKVDPNDTTTSTSSSEAFELIDSISETDDVKKVCENNSEPRRKKPIQLESRFAYSDEEVAKSDIGSTAKVEQETISTNPTEQVSNPGLSIDGKLTELKVFNSEIDNPNVSLINKSVSANPELIVASFQKEPEYTKAATDTADELKQINIETEGLYLVESQTAEPEYFDVSTDLEKMVSKTTATFEEDETYFSKYYAPLCVPIMRACGNIEYPESFNKLPLMGKEMKKLIYDVFIDFDVLHKNIESMNKYICDQSNDNLIFHTLQSSSGFSNYWRFFEIETVLQGAERKAKIFNDLIKHYNDLDDSCDHLRNKLFSDSRKISKYQDSLIKLEKKDMQFKKSYLNSDRPLNFENVKTRRILREKIKSVQDIDRTLQSEILILKSQIYPEQIVKDERKMNAVVNTLQQDLYTHADIISSFTKKFDALNTQTEQLDLLEQESSHKNLSVPDVEKEPVHRISVMLIKQNSKKSLANILKKKTNNNRYFSI